MTKTFAVAAGAALALFASPALAGPSSVKYDDLDLTTKAGTKELERRIESAAKEACGVESQRSGTRLASSSAKKCLAGARASARKQVAETVASANAADSG